MTDKTPATEAGRRLLSHVSDLLESVYTEFPVTADDILAIEAEARDSMEATSMQEMVDRYLEGRADALREAAERVRALPMHRGEQNAAKLLRAAVLAILEERVRERVRDGSAGTGSTHETG